MRTHRQLTERGNNAHGDGIGGGRRVRGDEVVVASYDKRGADGDVDHGEVRGGLFFVVEVGGIVTGTVHAEAKGVHC